MVVEKVRVTGWRVEIHLNIPIADDPPSQREPRPPAPGPRPSSDMGVRPLVSHKGDSYRLRDKDLGARPGAQPAEIA
jgi:hypothetical protein